MKDNPWAYCQAPYETDEQWEARRAHLDAQQKFIESLARESQEHDNRRIANDWKKP